MKIVDKAQRKFLFEFQELRAPGGVIVENGAMVGVNSAAPRSRTASAHGPEERARTVRAPLTISSIGSIPQPIPGIPQHGEVYEYVDQKIGLLMEGPTAVFAAGNVLTGKGNIKDSLDSGTEIGMRVAEAYLGLSDEKLDLAEGARKEAAASAEKIAGAMSVRPKIAPDRRRELLRARARTPACGRLRGQLSRVDRQGHAGGSAVAGGRKIFARRLADNSIPSSPSSFASLRPRL